MRRENPRLSGVFAPVVTPFGKDRCLLADLRYNLRKLAATKLAGYFALGSNGEFRSLSENERLRVLEVFAEEKAGKTVMAGTGAESTELAIRWTRRAAAMGFEYASLITPCYFPKLMNDETLAGFYLKIADASPVPILLYNVPGFTGGVQISPNAVRLLAEHPNIAGMKDSSPAGPARYLAAVGEESRFSVLAGSADTFYPALHLGAAGGIMSLANAIPGECCALHVLFVQGRYAEARSLNVQLMRLNHAISGAYGVPGVKAAMTMMGFRGGEPRHPLRPLGDEQLGRIATAFADNGIPVDEHYAEVTGGAKA